MTVKEMAKRLDGREYGCEVQPEEERTAKENGIVIVYGASDDLMEFAGAIHDEVDCWRGKTIRLTKDEVIQTPDCGNSDCPYFKMHSANTATIKAVWNDRTVGASWSYKTDIPHETFNVYEDGELYCMGIVFSVEDLKA